MGSDILFSPIRIGSVELKNRIIFPPLTTRTEVDGVTGELSLAFYRRLARGGAALICLGDVCATPTHSPNPLLCDDSYIPSLKEFTDAIHDEGALAAAQIFHPEYNYWELDEIKKTRGEDEFRKQFNSDLEGYCNRIDVSEIYKVQIRIREAAVRAEKAGFDLIQIHGDRLIGLFSSPLLNTRGDGYGGGPDGRFRFAIEMVAMLREALPDTPIEYKMAIIREDPPIGKAGPTLNEARILAPILEAFGVDAFHVSIANHTGVHLTIPPQGSQPYGCFTDLACGIREVVKVPVTAVGRIYQPSHAREIIESGQADLIAMGRQLICDPGWVEKAAAGQDDEIRFCIMCNRGCTDNVIKRIPVSCAINPSMRDLPSLKTAGKAEIVKTIAVIGAGPAGLEFARTAASRGHKVTVYEKDGQAGGQLILAAAPPGKDETLRILEFYERELNRLGVGIMTGVNADPEFIAGLKPDVAVIAIGGKPFVPKIPVEGPEMIINAWEVLKGKTFDGERVVVIGGGAVGAETAEFIAPTAKEVTIIEMLDRIAADESPTVKPFIFSCLEKYGVKIHTNTSVMRIENGKVICSDGKENIFSIACDRVVMAVGARTKKPEAESFSAGGVQTLLIGDCGCDRPGMIKDAIYSAYEAAITI